MKSLLVLVLSMSSLFASLPALAGKDAFQIWYQERFAAQKRAQQAELTKLQRCWAAHGGLMDKETTKK